jgi:hypothetical protein
MEEYLFSATDKGTIMSCTWLRKKYDKTKKEFQKVNYLTKNLQGWNYVNILGNSYNSDSVAEWSMALVLGTSLFGGNGSIPFTVILSKFDFFGG